MQIFGVLGPVYSRLAGYFKVVFRDAVPPRISMDWWRQQALATAAVQLFKHLIVDTEFWKKAGALIF